MNPSGIAISGEGTDCIMQVALWCSGSNLIGRYVDLGIDRGDGLIGGGVVGCSSLGSSSPSTLSSLVSEGTGKGACDSTHGSAG